MVCCIFLLLLLLSCCLCKIEFETIEKNQISWLMPKPRTYLNKEQINKLIKRKIKNKKFKRKYAKKEGKTEKLKRKLYIILCVWFFCAFYLYLYILLNRFLFKWPTPFCTDGSNHTDFTSCYLNAWNCTPTIHWNAGLLKLFQYKSHTTTYNTKYKDMYACIDDGAAL